MKKFNAILMLISVWILFGPSVQAKVKVADIFTDNMVIQADREITIWGNADMMELVTVELNQIKVSTRAGIDEKWSLDLPPMKYGGPYELKIFADDTLYFKNIMIGEVWLCAGQSNMRMTVNRVVNAKKEIAEANYDNIRFFTVPQKGTVGLQNSIDADWQICSPDIIGEKTATGYFFARKLNEELNVAVGLIDISFGGASILAFIDDQTIQSAVNQSMILASSLSREKMIKKLVMDWESNGRKGERPYLPQHISSLCYNAMVHPVVPFANRGAIWYQGESNVNAPDEYVHWFGDYISMMREKFNNPEMPFYFVQLAGFENQYNTNVAPEVWAKFRLAQEQCLQYSNTGMVTAMDIGQKDNIHPENKQEMGRRLALCAMNNTYGKKNLVCEGPVVKSVIQKGNKVIVTFKISDGGLINKNHTKLVSGFSAVLLNGEVIEVKGKIISEDSVEIKAQNVQRLRYAYANFPICTLYNEEGWPALSFDRIVE